MPNEKKPWVLAGSLVLLSGAFVSLMIAPRACAESPPRPTAPPSFEAPPQGQGEGEPGATGPSKVCLAWLRDRKVDFAEAPAKGVRTSIRLAGSTLGPLRLVFRDRRPGALMPVMDCELARALLEAAPLFQMAGARDLSFSGMYQYRTRRGSSRLSEHARGLAIDVHAFVSEEGKVMDVERDFEPGVGEWPSKDQVACVGSPEHPEGRLLRTLACNLRFSSAFREIITADDNADHKNHFHIEAFPDPLTRAKAILSHREPTIDD